MTATTDRVTTALRERGVEVSILEFPQGTRTAQEAAAAAGTTVGQIVKSLVFLADEDPVLVLASGSHRVDTGKLAAVSGARVVRKAGADEVRRLTGYSIGGVPPVGHDTPMPVYVDAALLEYDTVYAAAGTPTAVFAIAPPTLLAVTSGRVADLRDA